MLCSTVAVRMRAGTLPPPRGEGAEAIREAGTRVRIVDRQPFATSNLSWCAFHSSVLDTKHEMASGIETVDNITPRA
jgi:hypothetical protein